MSHTIAQIVSENLRRVGANLPFPSKDSQVLATRAETTFASLRSALHGKNAIETMAFLQDKKEQIFEATRNLPAEKAFTHLVNDILNVAVGVSKNNSTSINTFFWEEYGISTVANLIGAAKPEERDYIYKTSLERIPEPLKGQFIETVNNILATPELISPTPEPAH